MSLRQKFCMNNPLTVKKKKNKQVGMDFIFDLLILAFFERGDADVCHSLLCLFVSGSYSKIHVSLPVITFFKKFCHFGSVPEDKDTRPSDCPSVRLPGFWEQSSHTIFSWLIPVLKCDGPWCG